MIYVKAHGILKKDAIIQLLVFIVTVKKKDCTEIYSDQNRWGQKTKKGQGRWPQSADSVQSREGGAWLGWLCVCTSLEAR